MAQVAAETLGIPVARIRVELGNSTLPSAPVGRIDDYRQRRTRGEKAAAGAAENQTDHLGRSAVAAVPLLHRSSLPENGCLGQSNGTKQSVNYGAFCIVSGSR